MTGLCTLLQGMQADKTAELTTETEYLGWQDKKGWNYQMDNSSGIFGRFLMDEPASYEISSLDMESSWEYIYQNREILLRLDQFGPVDVQVEPPGDIILFKREKDDRFSRWLIWLQAEEINGGQPFTNFFRPVVSGCPNRTPDGLKIIYRPYEAVYSFCIEGLKLTTRFFVPNKGRDVHMEFEVESSRNTPVELNITPVMAPYVNQAQLAPWDKPEWYLKSGFGIEKEAVFWTRLLDASSVKENRRTAVLWSSSENLQSYEISMEKFVGAGDFYHPQAVYEQNLRLTSDSCEGYGTDTAHNQIYGYPPVYALRYRFMIFPGEGRKIQQVLSCPENEIHYKLQSLETAQKPLYLFEQQARQHEKAARKAFFDKLIGKNRIESQDPMLDYYVNTWLPLQMYWVASLDRGWPTGMRGTRDCANDFMGELYFQPEWTKGAVLLLFECQRSDGWFPRQISAKGRNGKHDLREFVDGGAFVVELLYEYLCRTGDFEILDKTVKWLDAEQDSTIIDHAAAAVEYYLKEENTGEHGLCKIRGGDWLDAVNRAGLEGKGESVMVTNQVIMSIRYLSRIADHMGKKLNRQEVWEEKKERLTAAVREHAFNKKGFFNGVYTDADQWIFSDCDPDGESRPYICANAYSIISGAADVKMRESALKAMESLKDDTGYRLFSPPIGSIPIEKVGRTGSGDGLMGLFENGAPYNHGSHGFLGRSLAVAGKKGKLSEVLKYMLPYDMEKHPTEEALTPPYAVVNCWQKIPLYKNRGGMCFLTGTTAMAIRLVYDWMLGIRPELDRLVIDPCCGEDLGDVKAMTTIRGIHLTVYLKQGGNRLYLDGKEIFTRQRDSVSGRECYYLCYEQLREGSVIDIRN